MKLKDITLFLASFFLVIASSCRKEDDFLTDTSAKLEFSEDTIIFDTVFTTIGSTTQYLIVYNRNDQPVKISNIRLAKGGSYFRLNIDGVAGNNQNDVEIRAKDSLFIFIEVTIDPNNQNTPLIVTDSILFNLNGSQQDVDLVAWGQDANYILPTSIFNGSLPYSLIDTNPCAIINWDSIKPYVIYGYAVVDTCQVLNIQEGTKIYSYNNGGLWVFQGGTLHVNGSKDHPVIFAGTRLEQSYADVPNQWDRIWINDGGNNTINYAVIKNSFIGIQVETILDNGTQAQLTLTNTIIKNAGLAGIFTRGALINSENTVFANCGGYCAWLLLGGDYHFKHCTFANYWSNGQRSTPAFSFSDYYYDQNSVQHHADLNLTCGNSIIYGNIANEIEADLKYSGSDNYHFTNCLFKNDPQVTPITDSNFTGNVAPNSSPEFIDYTVNDYHLQAGSPCINSGDISIGNSVPFDIEGHSRVGSPDLGAYEKQ